MTKDRTRWRGSDNRASALAVGHVLSVYLPRSATFIYTSLRFQRRFRPVILAKRTENVSEFPFDPILELLPQVPFHRRVAKRARAFASGYSRTYDFGLVREAQKRQCVALHAHFGYAGANSLVARERLEIPLVTTFYGHDLTAAFADWFPYDRLFSDGAMFFCEGPHMAGRLSELGCPMGKIRIVRIGIDLANSFPFSPPSRAAGPLVIIQAARFLEKKGVDLSIRAYAAARQRLGSSELWLVGDGPLRAELESLASGLGVSAFVRFSGMLSHDAYQELLRRAHICIQPSRTTREGDTEGGAPTVLLEMQAVGVLTVATRHADIPFVVPRPDDLVEEGNVEGLADELVRLANASDTEWRLRAEEGRALMEAEHDASALARRLEDFYAEALKAS
jgi:colanic acid/amylovoran biosynthesis glycosyltransferase